MREVSEVTLIAVIWRVKWSTVWAIVSSSSSSSGHRATCDISWPYTLHTLQLYWRQWDASTLDTVRTAVQRAVLVHAALTAWVSTVRAREHVSARPPRWGRGLGWKLKWDDSALAMTADVWPGHVDVRHTYLDTYDPPAPVRLDIIRQLPRTPPRFQTAALLIF